MEQLISALESATEGSRYLDSWITAYLGNNLDQQWKDPRWAEDCPRYSSSIDAALTLVPKAFEDDISGDFGIGEWSKKTHEKIGGACVWFLANGDLQSPGTIQVKGRGQTPALALCIAALKARQADD